MLWLTTRGDSSTNWSNFMGTTSQLRNIYVSIVPARIRGSRAVSIIRLSLMRRFNKINVVRSLPELDKKLETMDSASGGSVSKWIEMGSSFYFQDERKGLHKNPFSEEYKQQELDLYLKIAEIPEYVDSEAETFDFDVKEASDPYPFPYSTQDHQFIGETLIAIGFIIKTMKLKPGASILEYGPGSGATTILLATSGYDVTATDVNSTSLELIESLAARRGLSITTYKGAFGQAPESNTRFDAILFFKSFHHCLDHIKVVEKLWDLTKDEGILVFAGEPVSQSFSKPWGVRLDGQSLWQIRKNKWLELGFSESYFKKLLSKNGWLVSKYICRDSSSGTTFIARKKKYCR